MNPFNMQPVVIKGSYPKRRHYLQTWARGRKKLVDAYRLIPHLEGTYAERAKAAGVSTATVGRALREYRNGTGVFA